MVQSEKITLKFTPEMLLRRPNSFFVWCLRIASFIENPFLVGFAEKGHDSI